MFTLSGTFSVALTLLPLIAQSCHEFVRWVIHLSWRSPTVGQAARLVEKAAGDQNAGTLRDTEMIDAASVFPEPVDFGGENVHALVRTIIFADIVSKQLLGREGEQSLFFSATQFHMAIAEEAFHHSRNVV